MREIVILSGKGGTGKTSLTAAFASLAENKVLCDADVDAADLHLLAAPEVQQVNDFMGGGLAKINPELCTECGTCLDMCRFGAIDPERFIVNGLHCEGCGVCVDFCPARAIDFPIQKCGEWFLSESKFGPMVHARLGIAEENSGKLVSVVRKAARDYAEEHERDLILTDGPPGIGCPVIAALSGATLVVIVVEPTVSGVHDMMRVADLAVHFQLPGMVCINKYDINPKLADSIVAYAAKRNMEVVGRIPFDPVFVQAMVVGQNIFEYGQNSELLDSVQSIWQKIIDAPALNRLGIVNLKSVIQ